MNEALYQIISLDLPPILTSLFASISCALLGNFLLLRRISLMGDAISHAVLPGIVVAFLLSHTRDALWMFVGAALAGLLATIFIELIRKAGRMDSGAAMGVVFSIFFALGVVLIEQAAARSVDLDADCLLHGQLESIFWFPPHSLSALFSFGALAELPLEVWTAFVTAVLTVAFVLLFFKELTISAFDPGLGDALGYSSSVLHFSLMIVVAAAVVAAFSAVGSILVIAMIICPGATARLLTDKLPTQLWLSVCVACTASVGGYLLGAFGPPYLGWTGSVNAAGSITVVLGVFLALSVIFSPSYGLVAGALKNWRLSIQVLREDILGVLYRQEENSNSSDSVRIDVSLLPESLRRGLRARLAFSELLAEGFVLQGRQGISLTTKGRDYALQLVRSHRLWEHYLVEKLGLAPDHTHKSASKLEHYTGDSLAERLAEAGSNPVTDPHGKPIPERENS